MAKKDEKNDEAQEEVQEADGQAEQAAEQEAQPDVPGEPDVDRAAQTIAAAAPDAEEGKLFAILSYALNLVCLPFCIVPLIMRNNEFALYHAKQSLLVLLAGIVVWIVGVPLMAVCIGFVLVPAAGIFLLVLDIIGIVNAAKLETKPLPLIGKWAEQWFKAITKV